MSGDQVEGTVGHRLAALNAQREEIIASHRGWRRLVLRLIAPSPRRVRCKLDRRRDQSLRRHGWIR